MLLVVSNRDDSMQTLTEPNHTSLVFGFVLFAALIFLLKDGLLG